MLDDELDDSLRVLTRPLALLRLERGVNALVPLRLLVLCVAKEICDISDMQVSSEPLPASSFAELKLDVEDRDKEDGVRELDGGAG